VKGAKALPKEVAFVTRKTAQAVLLVDAGVVHAAKQMTRQPVFWSGANSTRAMPKTYVATEGGVTLNMTIVGRIRNLYEQAVLWSAPSFAEGLVKTTFYHGLWTPVSAWYAINARLMRGDVVFFTTSKGPSPNSIWIRIEKPLLGNTPIKTVIVPEGGCGG
jgi:hypothetical protein